jgi:hypothetical protein
VARCRCIQPGEGNDRSDQVGASVISAEDGNRIRDIGYADAEHTSTYCIVEAAFATLCCDHHAQACLATRATALGGPASLHLRAGERGFDMVALGCSEARFENLRHIFVRAA